MGASGYHQRRRWDPLFIPGGATTTAAEMAREDKQCVSHRAKALKALEPLLKQAR